MSPPTPNDQQTSPGACPEILLIPWDPDSPAHVDRMVQQRLACGWHAGDVEAWAALQREGKKGLHWIVLPPSHPDTGARLQKHATAYPKEAAPLEDSCRTVLSRRHTPRPELGWFQPIGHLSLDPWNIDRELRTSASNCVYALLSFYISGALQGGGLGAAALRSCESMAVTGFGCKAITLRTISNEEYYPENPRRRAMGLTETPKPTNEDWYSRRGYRIYLHKPDAWFETDPVGKEWGVAAVYMEKGLS